jgi:hypothetical protein
MLQYLIGFLIFVGLFSISFLLWRYFFSERGHSPSLSNDGEDYTDLTHLLDQSRDKDYLHGKTDKYEWSQNEREIELVVPLISKFVTTRKDLNCEIKSNSITLKIKDDVVISGDFYSEVINRYLMQNLLRLKIFRQKFWSGHRLMASQVVLTLRVIRLE